MHFDKEFSPLQTELYLPRASRTVFRRETQRSGYRRWHSAARAMPLPLQKV